MTFGLLGVVVVLGKTLNYFRDFYKSGLLNLINLFAFALLQIMDISLNVLEIGFHALRHFVINTRHLLHGTVNMLCVLMTVFAIIFNENVSRVVLDFILT